MDTVNIFRFIICMYAADLKPFELFFLSDSSAGLCVVL